MWSAWRIVTTPLVSIVVVNWNGAAFIERCLDSVIDQSYANTEIIVVDNGSVDGSVDLLARTYGDRIRVIARDSNAGFAGGVNEGIRVSGGAWVALLNNDAVADRRWIESLVRTGEQNSAIGMCASRIFMRGLDDVIDGAGLLLSRDGIGRGRGRLEKNRNEFEREEDVLVPSGCAAAYRRVMLDQVGLFDEDFFAYCEDTDLGLRARLAGWRCRYSPGAIVHHDYSRSSSPYSSFKAFQVERNRIWVLVKCFPVRDVLLSVGYSVGRYVMQGYGAIVGRGAAARMQSDSSFRVLIWTVISAWWAALRQLPTMLERRRRIMSHSRVSATEFRAWLSLHSLSVRDIALRD